MGASTETPTASYEVVEPGIIIQRVKMGTTQGTAEAQENVDTFNSLTGDTPHCVLVDMREPFAISKEGRDLYDSPDATRNLTASALLVGSSVSRMVGNLFLQVTRPSRPCKMFTDETEALAWLRQVMSRAA